MKQSVCKTWIRKTVAALSVVIITFSIHAFCLLFADYILVIRQIPKKSDVIVVLSGETRDRTKQALELFKLGYAKKIIVSGREDDKTRITLGLLESGIPVDKIIIENSSRSTFENAKNTSKLLKKLQISSIILVTSWYHSRRATAVFKSVDPTITITSVPTQSECIADLLKDRRTMDRVMAEYMKLGYYYMKYMVKPII